MNENRFTDERVVDPPTRALERPVVRYDTLSALEVPSGQSQATVWRLAALGSCSEPAWRPLPARAGGLHRPHT